MIWVVGGATWTLACVFLVRHWDKTPYRTFVTDKGPELCLGGLLGLLGTQFVVLADAITVGWVQTFFGRHVLSACLGMVLILAARRLVADDFLGLSTSPRLPAFLFGIAAWVLLLPANLGVHWWHKQNLEDPDVLQESMSAFLDLVRDGHAGIFVPMTVVLVVIVPMIEEIVFRGWLQTGVRNSLQDTLGPQAARVIAVGISAVVFTFVHPPFTWPPVAFLGILLGILYERTGCLWAGVGFHGLHNLFTLYYAVWQS